MKRPSEKSSDPPRAALFSPMKKFGKPEDLGAFIAFLCSKHGDFFSGSAIHVDGAAIKGV